MGTKLNALDSARETLIQTMRIVEGTLSTSCKPRDTCMKWLAGEDQQQPRHCFFPPYSVPLAILSVGSVPIVDAIRRSYPYRECLLLK